MSEVVLEFGLLLGSIVGLPVLLGQVNLWPILFWLEICPSALALGILPFLPESPKFLLANGELEMARESILFFQPDLTSRRQEMDILVSEIQNEIQLAKENLGFREIWKHRIIRKAILIGSLANFIVPFSGVNAVDLFGVYILELVGLSANTASYTFIAIGLAPLLSATISTIVMDKVGRRPLLIGSLVLLAILNALIMIFLALFRALSLSWLGYLSVIDLILLNFAFSLGPGTIQWFITAEMVPQNARSSAQRVANISQWVSNFIASTAYFPLEGVAGPYSFLMFVIPLLVSSILLYFYLPETKNLPAGEIMNQLSLGRVTRRKKSHQAGLEIIKF